MQKNQERKDPIQDKEMEKIFNRTVKKDIDNDLEDKILETDIGKKIKSFEKMGISGISIKNIVEQYKQIEGYSFSKEGTFLLNEESLMLIINSSIQTVNEKYGVNVLKIKEDDLRKLATLHGRLDAQTYYSKAIDEEGIVNENYVNKYIDKNGSEELKVDESFTRSFMNSMFIDSNKKDIFEGDIKSFYKDKNYVSDSDLSKYLKSFSKDSAMKDINVEDLKNSRKQDVDNFINTKEEVDFLSLAHEISKGKDVNKNLKLIRKLDVKFSERSKNNEGKITQESVNAFIDEYCEQRNNADVSNMLMELLKEDTEDIKSKPRNYEKTLIVMIRAAKSKDDNNIKMLQTLAEKNGLNIFKDGESKEIDFEKIKRLSGEFFGDFETAERVVHSYEWNEDSMPNKIKKLKEDVEKNPGEGRAQSFDEISERKRQAIEHSNKAQYQIKNVLKSYLIDNPDFYEKEENQYMVLSLLHKYRTEHLEGKEIDEKDINGFSSRDDDKSNAVKEFILENPKYFEKYINSNGVNLNGKNIMEELEKPKNLSLSAKSNLFLADKQINIGIQLVDKAPQIYNRDREKLSDAIESYGKKGNDRSEKDVKNIFKRAKKIPYEAYTTKELDDLKSIDSEKFDKLFGKYIEKDNKRGFLNKFLITTVRAVGKMAVMPALLVSESPLKKIIPNISNNNKNNENLPKKVTIVDKIKNLITSKNKTDNNIEAKLNTEKDNNDENSKKAENILSFCPHVEVDISKVVNKTMQNNDKKDVKEEKEDFGDRT